MNEINKGSNRLISFQLKMIVREVYQTFLTHAS